LFDSLKRIIKKIRYRKMYPGMKIGSTANISEDVLLSGDVSIGDFVTIAKSSLGQGTTVYGNCMLNRVVTDNNVYLYEQGVFDDVVIGRYSYIASHAAINMATIGRYCSIGPYIICGYGDHPANWLSTSPVFYSVEKQCGITFTDVTQFKERRRITIGHDVWIGARVYIRDGMVIGNGSIIAAGAVVVKDVPDYAVVGGVPARVIRFRFSPDIIERLLSIAWWNWPISEIVSAKDNFVRDDVSTFVKSLSVGRMK